MVAVKVAFFNRGCGQGRTCWETGGARLEGGKGVTTKTSDEVF